ncbi:MULTISPECIES: YlxR family protein [Nocardiopsis]|uniref:YlxR family protein n=1 Tax=Nocardiopsis TaxID=2013 RepID=UPI00059430B1|nr:YlxR family protein [Nocardiopsis sp. EMB25]
MSRRDKVGEGGLDRPVRTCVGCRSRAVQSDLVRLVAEGTAITPDTRGRRPGRGAYLHDDRRCLELAVRRRVWARAFRSRDGGGSTGWDLSRVEALIGATPSGGSGGYSG